jgi:hypothetical protein
MIIIKEEGIGASGENCLAIEPGMGDLDGRDCEAAGGFDVGDCKRDPGD